MKNEFLWDSVITELKGDGILESMIVKNVKTNEETEIFADEDDGYIWSIRIRRI